MYNYVVTKLAAGAVGRQCFAAGTCIGGFCGIVLGLAERSAVGILGGAFLGLAFGLACALGGAAFAAIFNLLAPYLGGIAVKLEPAAGTPRAPAAGDDLQTPTERTDSSPDLRPPFSSADE